MPLSYFPVTGQFTAVITDRSSDEGGQPDEVGISCTVWFRPSVRQIHSTVDGTVYRLQDLRARTTLAGELETVDGSTVSLPANTAVLDLDELTYRVDFEDVTYDAADADEEMSSFRFVARTDTTPVDLATVERLPV